MEAKAIHRYARTSAQKARLVADQVRGMPVNQANAENNVGANADNLYVSEVMVDEGPSLKRIRARAKGRADRITKRTSHITLVVAER